MSCIRFNTPAQLAAMRSQAPSQLSPEEAARLHPAPVVTESKLRRLRLLAQDADPRIRESVASKNYTPQDVLERLARDEDEGVRACVAKNEHTSCEILRAMADDPSDTVRGWLAVNYFVPADVMERLAHDPSETVRKLVHWKGSLVEA